MAKSKSNELSSRFTLADNDLKKRTVASVEGEVGTGKTHFCLTARGPHLVQNIDLGTEGVVEKFIDDGKTIYDEKYVWLPGEEEDPTALKEAAIEVRDKWEKDFRYAIDNGIGTVIWDTESRIWQVYRYAAWGGPNGDDIRDYDALNMRFEANIARAKQCEVNLFLIRSLKDKWGMVAKGNGGKGFGKGGREVWGYEHLPSMMFMELSFRHDPKDEETYGDPYTIAIGKCRHNKNLSFTVQPRMTFPELGTLMDENSKEEDWA